MDVLEVEFKDYSDFVKNFGMPFSRERVPLSFIMVGNFFENLGVLYSNKLLDASLIIQLFPITLAWEKMKPIIYGLREEYHSPQYYEWFEYLYNEVKQRQQPASQTA